MSDQLNAKMAHFVEITAAALDDANQKVAAAASARQAYDTRVPEVVDQLITMGFLKAASRTVAIQKLTDPAYALDQLVKLASASTQDGADTNSLGTQVTPPTDPASATTQKRANQKRWGAHGDKFVESLGLDPNTL